MKVIVLDFDGTLGDTQSVIIKSFRETVVKGGYPEPTDEACVSIIGLSLNDCFTTMLHCSVEEATRLGVIYTEVFHHNVQNFKIQPFEGVLETLAELKRRGYTLTIATSRAKHSALEIIPLSGVGAYVETIIAPQDVEHGKPAPDLTLKILEKYPVNPADTWVVGDAPVDILMGKSAGCKTCAVTYGNGKLEELKAVKPDCMIDRFADLLDIV